jgi:hypothetical protein
VIYAAVVWGGARVQGHVCSERAVRACTPMAVVEAENKHRLLRKLRRCHDKDLTRRAGPAQSTAHALGWLKRPEVSRSILSPRRKDGVGTAQG